MKKYITDKENICLRCKNGHVIGKCRPGNYPEDVTWCTCQDVSLHGANKGERRQCKAFAPRREGVGS